MQMVIFTTVIGKMTKHTDLEFTLILTELDTKATGKKIISTVKVLKLGLMVPLIMVFTKLEKSTEKAFSLGLMAAHTLAPLMTTTSRVKVFTAGVMVEYLMVIGETIRWKVKAFLIGQMEENTSESISMIKRKEWALFIGQMGVNTKECGKMGSRTAKEHIPQLLVSPKLENGRMGKELVGYENYLG